MTRAEKRVRVNMRKDDVEAWRAQLNLDVRTYEFRYEVSSEKMRQLLQAGKERETGDVLKWMSAYSSLQQLEAKFPGYSPHETEDNRLDNERKSATTHEEKVNITVRKSPAGEFQAQLRRSIKKYEGIFEIESQNMLELLSDFKVRETAELTDWMFDYKALRYLEEAPRDSEGNIITPEATDAEVEEYRVGLKLNISNYEDRYKMTSEQMLDLLSKGQFQENIEIIEWKFDLRDLRVLEEEIPTTGKPMTVTAPSTNFD